MRVRLPHWLGIFYLFTGASPGWCDAIRIGPVYSSAERVELQLELPTPRTAFDKRSIWLVEDGVATVVAIDLKPARETQRGMSAIIAVDVSGSMKRGPLEDARKALRVHASEFTSSDSVALVSFASDVKSESDFGASQRPEMLSAIDGLRSRGKTTILYDGLSQCIETLRSAKAPRRRVIVISDGLDEKSTARIEDVIQRAKQYGVAIDAIGRGTVTEDYSNSLYRLAKESGGLYAYAGAGEMSEKYKAILDQIESMPVAVFERKVNPSGAKTGKLAIEIVSSGRAPEISEEIAMAIPATLLQTPSSGSIPWTVIVILVLAIAAIVVFILMRRKSGKEEDEDNVDDQGHKKPLNGPATEPSGDKHVSPPGDGGRVPSKHKVTEFDHSPRFPSETIPRAAITPVGLRVISGPLEGTRAAVRPGIFRIGADADNDLLLTEDSWVSGHHAQINFHEGRLTIRDVGSRHGTSVDGQKINEAHPLVPGSTIQLGNSVLEVVVEEAASTDTVR